MLPNLGTAQPPRLVLMQMPSLHPTKSLDSSTSRTVHQQSPDFHAGRFICSFPICLVPPGMLANSPQFYRDGAFRGEGHILTDTLSSINFLLFCDPFPLLNFKPPCLSLFSISLLRVASVLFSRIFNFLNWHCLAGCSPQVLPSSRYPEPSILSEYWKLSRRRVSKEPLWMLTVAC